MGGMISLEIMRQAPERVKNLSGSSLLRRRRFAVNPCLKELALEISFPAAVVGPLDLAPFCREASLRASVVIESFLKSRITGQETCATFPFTE